MRWIYTFSVVMVFALGGCASDAERATVREYAYVDDEYVECTDNAPVIAYSTPNGNDLVLETAHHVIQIDARPNVAYGYYVWAGDKTYESDPDLVVEDGTAYILQGE